MVQNYYPNFQTQQQPRPPQQFGLKGRPVSSLDEVRATTIDFDGSMFFFPDLANKRIYTKQINMDGTASLNVYELKNVPIEPDAGNYVTREEFNAALAQFKSLLSQQPQTQAQNNVATQF